MWPLVTKLLAPPILWGRMDELCSATVWWERRLCSVSLRKLLQVSFLHYIHVFLCDNSVNRCEAHRGRWDQSAGANKRQAEIRPRSWAGNETELRLKSYGRPTAGRGGNGGVWNGTSTFECLCFIKYLHSTSPKKTIFCMIIIMIYFT